MADMDQGKIGDPLDIETPSAPLDDYDDVIIASAGSHTGTEGPHWEW